MYEPYSKTKLNLFLCDDISINIYIPMELSEFYQDICTPYDSQSGTDIL